MEYFDFPINEIIIPQNRARRLKPGVVTQIVDSIAQIGLRQPVTLTKDLGCKCRLIAGLHRIEAFKTLRRATIPSVILDGCSALEAEEIELRENLDRAELSPAEKTMHFARLKIISEEKYKLTGASVMVPRAEGATKSKASNTAKILAQQTGRSAQSIERGSLWAASIPRLSEIVGTSLDKGVEMEALAKLPPEQQDALIDRAVAGDAVSVKTAAKQFMRAKRERELGSKQLALPDRKFGVIYADPEWSFETWSENGMDRAADNHYPTSALETIKQRDVPSIAADDCVLFLWATVPMLPEALEVMAAWGFTYKSNFAWIKSRPGTGYWSRNKHEHLLIGTKGSIPAPAMGEQYDSIFNSQQEEHSVKPDIVYEIIEDYFPSLPKIELDARRLREGWESWGLEAQK